MFIYIIKSVFLKEVYFYKKLFKVLFDFNDILYSFL